MNTFGEEQGYYNKVINNTKMIKEYRPYNPSPFPYVAKSNKFQMRAAAPEFFPSTKNVARNTPMSGYILVPVGKRIPRSRKVMTAKKTNKHGGKQKKRSGTRRRSH